MDVQNDDGSSSSQAMGTDDKSHEAIQNEVVKISFNSTLSSHQ